MEAMLATFLSPFLSYLLNRTEDVATAAAKRFGSEAWERAQAIWTRLGPKVEGKDAAREAAEDVAAVPDDEVARAALQHQFKKLLKNDAEFADEVARMLDDTRRAGIMADNGAVVIGGNVTADRGGVAAGRDIDAGQGGIHTGESAGS
jgi:hypothetical protein